MSTLNQILTQIEDYFQTHALVNGVNITLDDDDFNALVDLSYPVVNIQYLDTDVNERLLIHNLKVTIGDLTNPNVELLDISIYSDCIQIAEDFFGWLETQYGFDWNKNTNIQPFSDSNTDRVSGIVFTMAISTFRKINADCAAPHKD